MADSPVIVTNIHVSTQGTRKVRQPYTEQERRALIEKMIEQRIRSHSSWEQVAKANEVGLPETLCLERRGAGAGWQGRREPAWQRHVGDQGQGCPVRTEGERSHGGDLRPPFRVQRFGEAD